MAAKHHNITPEVIQAFKDIFDRIYLKMYDSSSYIFLCGSGDADSDRNALRVELEKLRINVFYPEDLLMDMIDIDNNNDLFSFEGILAKESNAICVICESIGSAAEMGAFVQNKDLQSKLILCTNFKYKNAKSFIRIGPLRYHMNNAGYTCFYKKSDMKGFAKDVSTYIKLIKKGSTPVKENVSLISLINFIPISLWFYGVLNRKILFEILKQVFSVDNSEFQILFNVSINYLIKNRLIEVNYGDKKYDDELRLSSQGERGVHEKLFRPPVSIDKIKLIDKKRCGMMYLSLYSNHPPLV